MVQIVNGHIIHERVATMTASPVSSPLGARARRNSFQELSREMQQEQQRKDQLYQQYVQAVSGSPDNSNPPSPSLSPRGIHASVAGISAGTGSDSPLRTSAGFGSDLDAPLPAMCAHCGCDPSGHARTISVAERLMQTTLVFGFNLSLVYLLLFTCIATLFGGLHGLMIMLLVVYLGTVYSSNASSSSSTPATSGVETMSERDQRISQLEKEITEEQQKEGSPFAFSPTRLHYQKSPTSISARRNSFAGPGFRLNDSGMSTPPIPESS